MSRRSVWKALSTGEKGKTNTLKLKETYEENEKRKTQALYKNKMKTKEKKTRAKSSYGTCDEVRSAKSQEIIWYEV